MSYTKVLKKQRCIVTNYVFRVESIVTYHWISRKKSISQIDGSLCQSITHIFSTISSLCWGGKFHFSSLNLHRNCQIFIIIFNFTLIQYAYPTYSGSSFFNEITIMIRYVVIQPHLMIRHYVLHLTISNVQWFQRCN